MKIVIQFDTSDYECSCTDHIPIEYESVEQFEADLREAVRGYIERRNLSMRIYEEHRSTYGMFPPARKHKQRKSDYEREVNEWEQARQSLNARLAEAQGDSNLGQLHLGSFVELIDKVLTYVPPEVMSLDEWFEQNKKSV